MTDQPYSATPLGRYPWIVIRLRCHVCERQADVRLTACVARYGYAIPVSWVLRRFMSGCPWDPFTEIRKPQKYGTRCGAYMPISTRPARPICRRQ